MLNRAVIKEFLVEKFKDAKNQIPKEIDLDKLTEDFSIYVENDYYEWLQDNFKSYFYQTKFSWDDVKDKLKNKSNKPI